MMVLGALATALFVGLTMYGIFYLMNLYIDKK